MSHSDSEQEMGMQVQILSRLKPFCINKNLLMVWFYGFQWVIWHHGTISPGPSDSPQVLSSKANTLHGSCWCKKWFWPWQDLNLYPHLLLRGHMVLYQWANPDHESKYIACCKWFLLIQKRFWPWQDLNLHPHGGSRTRNLLLRRLAPYPLGHMVLFQWATRPSDKPKQM